VHNPDDLPDETRTGKIIGVAAVVIAVLAILPSLVSALGVALALVSLIVAGVAGAHNAVNLALSAAAITTVNLFGLSVLTLTDNVNTRMMLFVGVPYLIFGLGLGVAWLRRRHGA
jgi:hypothetical protein